MTILRSSVIAFLCLLSLTNAASSVTQTPLDTVENFSEKWGWKDCGSFCIILSGYLLLAFIHSHTIGMETDPIQIQSIEISPDPPLPGKPLTVKVTGTASEVIEVGPQTIIHTEFHHCLKEGATADVTVKLGLIKLLTKTFDVCEEAYVPFVLIYFQNAHFPLSRSANASVQCPVEKGQYIVEQTVDLPKEIPPGSFIVLSFRNTSDPLTAKFNIHIDGYTVDEDDLMCMDLTIDFTKKHFW